MPVSPKDAKRLGLPVGAIMPAQFHYWRWFEDMLTAQGLWEWWRSGKAMAGESGCVFEEMMENR